MKVIYWREYNIKSLLPGAMYHPEGDTLLCPFWWLYPWWHTFPCFRSY